MTYAPMREPQDKHTASDLLDIRADGVEFHEALPDVLMQLQQLIFFRKGVNSRSRLREHAMNGNN